MPCFHPLTAYRAPPGLDIARSHGGISFDARYAGLPGVEELKIPCNQCIGCRLERSRQWAIRICHEKQFHNESCFITLTYDNEHIPENESLCQEHMTLFLKRLRKKLEPLKIRYFYCGEYGSKTQRPHYHLCLFGYSFQSDRKVYKCTSTGILYISKTLQDLWSYGYAPFGDLTFESAAYTARYILKKVTGDPAAEHYGLKKPEFICMSRRPGIGADWFEKYSKDVYPKDFITIKQGIKCRPPRYYDKLYKEDHCEELYEIKQRRKENAERVADLPERLSQREVVTRLRTSTFLRRRIEQNGME